MILDTLVVGPLGVNCYLIGDAETRQAIVIDPGGNARDILKAIERLKLQVTLIVNTHAHFDHVIALSEIRVATRAPFVLHAEEAPVLAHAQASAALFGMTVRQPDPADRLLEEGDDIRVGSLAFKVLHTPGHTPGGLCLSGEQCVITGDTLFQGSIGRTDLPGGDYVTLMQSIRDKLLMLPDATVVYPGHGDATTMGEERALNPFLRPLITGQWNV
ncbi:MAG: MBL fold metallo-hydrolase [Chloroflexi bacterium]|nr:MBL fold metallo-hydrolase [Chloroflexota bacterium]